MHEQPDADKVNSLVEIHGCSAVEGAVRWDPVHSLWNGFMLAAAFTLAPLLASWSAVGVFLVLTGASLLLGHSVGFHRLLIHRSFACPLWLERVLVWIGTAVGMSGPFWMIRTHDLRDWAQRQTACHDYLAHRRPMLVDAWWQLHCRLELANPPAFDLGRAGRDRFYRILESSWMAQQIPLAALLYAGGGWSWLVWGVCVRVSACVTGHWFVGHLAHRRGPQSWLVETAGVQAHDVPWAAIPTIQLCQNEAFQQSSEGSTVGGKTFGSDTAEAGSESAIDEVELRRLDQPLERIVRPCRQHPDDEELFCKTEVTQRRLAIDAGLRADRAGIDQLRIERREHGKEARHVRTAIDGRDVGNVAFGDGLRIGGKPVPPPPFGWPGDNLRIAARRHALRDWPLGRR